MRPDWLIKATQQTSAHKKHKQAVCRLNDAVLKVIAKVRVRALSIIHCSLQLPATVVSRLPAANV